MSQLRVVMIAGECVPFAKVGGLADILGALPIALDKLGVQVAVVIPRHRAIDLPKFGFTCVLSSERSIPLGFETVPYDVHRAKMPGSLVDVFLIGNDRFFHRDGIYVDETTGKDYPDQAERWIFFQRAAMDFLSTMPAPDILHCHDHQTGLIPAYLKKIYRSDLAFQPTRTVFTIHNMGYQGLFPREAMSRTGFNDAEFYPTSPFEFYGMMNFMKVAVMYADVITTVSETYAREIQETREFGYGLEDVVRERSKDFVGILNGIDDSAWNPATDTLIPATYSAANLSGKIKNKAAVAKVFGLDDSHMDWPLLAMISRIDAQKGFDLVLSVLDFILSRDAFFVLLGSGNKETEGYLRNLIERYPGKAGIRMEFDDRSAHLTEAGADMFLMPSRYEPCGLNQMYSMRYGTVPIVRATGGLADTVQEFDPSAGSGTGFSFKEYDPAKFKAAISRAFAFWLLPHQWQRLMINGMRQDFSWASSAKKYIEVYKRAVSNCSAGL